MPHGPWPGFRFFSVQRGPFGDCPGEECFVCFRNENISLVALGENGALLLGAGGRCPWGDPGRCSRSWEEGFGLWAGVDWPQQLRGGMRTSPSDPRDAGRATPYHPQEVKSWGPDPARSPRDTPHDPAPPDCPRSKVTWPHPPQTQASAGTFLANSIFAPLGSSVEIKRLFAVTNVANSD